MAKEKIAVDTRDVIISYLKGRGITLQWVSNTTEINYNSLHSCLVKKMFLLSDENLKKINKALETDFKL